MNRSGLLRSVSADKAVGSAANIVDEGPGSCNHNLPHQQNVKTSPGPPRGVMVPLVLLVRPDPPWFTFSVKFQKVWITMDLSGPGGPRGPLPPLVDQERSGLPWTTLRHFPDAGVKYPLELARELAAEPNLCPASAAAISTSASSAQRLEGEWPLLGVPTWVANVSAGCWALEASIKRFSADVLSCSCLEAVEARS